MNKRGEVLTAILAILAGIGAFLSVLVMDEPDEKCWAKENAAVYYPAELITCDGEDCRVALAHGFEVKMNCSCERDSSCRIER